MRAPSPRLRCSLGERRTSSRRRSSNPMGCRKTNATRSPHAHRSLRVRTHHQSSASSVARRGLHPTQRPHQERQPLRLPVLSGTDGRGVHEVHEVPTRIPRVTNARNATTVPDHSACGETQCTRRKQCARYRMVRSDRQSVFSPSSPGEECSHFWSCETGAPFRLHPVDYTHPELEPLESA